MQIACVGDQIVVLQFLRVHYQDVSHRPKLILLARAAGGIRRSGGVIMNRQGQIAGDIEYFTGVDVVLLDVIEDTGVETAAVRALIVCKLDQRKGRRWVA